MESCKNMAALKQIKLCEVLSRTLPREERFQRYRELWNQAERKQALTDFPLHLDVELSGACNLKCECCFQNGYIERKLGFMRMELFQSIIDQGIENGLCAIKLQIRGESFLHPKWFECVRYAKESGVMDVQITTNATLLNEKQAHEILASGLDGIVFSVDAHHGESWHQRNQNEPYQGTIERNIRQFLSLRKSLGKKWPQVRMRASISETDQASYERTKERIQATFPDVDIVVVNRLHNFSDSEDSYPDLHTHYRLLPCSHLFQRLAVFWDGQVTACCMDYNNRFQLGDARKQRIQEIWLGERMQRMRDIHLAGGRKKMDICKHCHAYTTPIENTYTYLDPPAPFHYDGE